MSKFYKYIGKDSKFFTTGNVYENTHDDCVLDNLDIEAGLTKGEHHIDNTSWTKENFVLQSNYKKMKLDINQMNVLEWMIHYISDDLRHNEFEKKRIKGTVVSMKYTLKIFIKIYDEKTYQRNATKTRLNLMREFYMDKLLKDSV